MRQVLCGDLFFFFNDTATTEIYTLSLHDALPISSAPPSTIMTGTTTQLMIDLGDVMHGRSEEHTSELQSQFHLVCRLLLEKKKKKKIKTMYKKKKIIKIKTIK